MTSGLSAQLASTDRRVLGTIACFVVTYLLALAAGWPQEATRQIIGVNQASAHLVADEEQTPAVETRVPPAFWTVAPFVLLLGAIAILPLVPGAEHWWESNLHKFYVAGGLALLTLLYYGLLHPTGVERHFVGHRLVERSGGGFSWPLVITIVQNAILQDFVPFIVLLFSLYTISGGIRIQGDLPAHPLTNACFMGAGGVLASLIGTTGAAMVLIRPLLDTNSERRHVRHTVVFFIFIVCNCGGCLLPLGDPPLFLGYLQGVDFLWTLSLWKQWLLVNASLLAIYLVWDHFFSYPREARRDVLRDETQVRRLRYSGLWTNTPLLLSVVLAVALLDPSKTIPGTGWHPWLYLREMVLLSLVGASLALGQPSVRQANRFNYGAIVEVAVLFLGIFICMQPALQILSVRGPQLGIDTPVEFFWTTGALSSVLDNAPTYLVFFQTAQSLGASGPQSMPHLGIPDALLAAVSLGAVFMGANTYIGNGPNFMVKTIAEKSGVRMPSFFGYMAYSAAILLPLFVIVSLFM